MMVGMKDTNGNNVGLIKNKEDYLEFRKTYTAIKLEHVVGNNMANGVCVLNEDVK
jgi:hypothetical protein